MVRPLRRSRTRYGIVVRAVLASLLSAPLLYGLVRPAYADVAVGAGAGDFLQFEIGGRSAGMGGAQVGSASGVTAQFWNPAGLASLQRPQVGGMHASWLGDLKYEWIGYARPTSLGVGSLSVSYFHMPSIAGVDEFGTPTGEFKVYDMAVTAGLSRPVGDRLSLGANAKMVRQNLATVSATGFAVDFGAQAKGPKGVTFGAVVQNLGPSLSFDGSSYPLSRQIRFGASGEVANGRVLLASDYNMPSDYYDDVRVGAELRAHPNVSLRVGYRQVMGEGDNPQSGL
ncbi:MAG TPA: PorV/PorQ family protein, partial [Candidatus Eisenbacteria bacterium]|nr:PorV/PorQ family protein [Candidatus Eisenbacteria bacterium]